MLLLVQFLGGLFIGWVLQVWSEQAKVLLLLCSVFVLLTVELCIFLLYFLLNETGVAHSDVVVGAAWNFLAEILQALSRCSQLSYLLDLEALCLLLHVLQEDTQVGRNAIAALQILDVVPSVQFLAQVLAHGLNADDCLREPHIGLTRIFESNGSKHFKLLILALLIKSLLFLVQLNRLLRFAIRDSIQLLQLLLEATQVLSVVPDRADDLHQCNPHADRNSLLTLTRGASPRDCLVKCETIIEGFVAQILNLVDELIDSLLGLLTLGHLGTHALLS